MFVVLRVRDYSLQLLEQEARYSKVQLVELLNFTLVKVGDARKKEIELISKKIEWDRNKQGVVSDSLTSKIILKFNGHEKYILELHPKAKKCGIKNGDTFVFLATVPIEKKRFVNTQYGGLNLILDGISDKKLHSFQLEIIFFSESSSTITSAIDNKNEFNWFSRFQN